MQVGHAKRDLEDLKSQDKTTRRGDKTRGAYQFAAVDVRVVGQELSYVAIGIVLVDQTESRRIRRTHANDLHDIGMAKSFPGLQTFE